MLVPEVQPAPKATRHIGRAQVVIGGVAHETQVLFFTDEEAREWAMVGRDVTASQAHSTRHSLDKDPVTVTAEAPGKEPAPAGGIPAQRITEGNFEKAMEAAFAAPEYKPEKPAESPISLREAVDKGVVSVSLSVIRQAASGNRDPEFPPNVGKNKRGAFLYHPEALRKWERNRPGSKKNDDD
ncbi:hypothetical protein D7231_34525 [Streptomyces klenkii]|uniref:Uncharacterized protein n=1 Tax=Streptomyces klenkii TaxID=1420899 RepID=A0A3B0A723_9ACTN|nr:hypothetical protein D7231_34525 [Streptomyces klenkii]